MSAPTQQRGRIEGFRIGLRWARESKGWTQVQAALEATIVARQISGNPDAKVSHSLIAMIESGAREPSYEVAEWIAASYGKTVEDFALVRESA